MDNRWVEFEDGQLPKRGDLVMARFGKMIYPQLLIVAGPREWWVWDDRGQEIFERTHKYGGTSIKFEMLSHWTLIDESVEAGINWDANKWFAEHYANQLTDAFKTWWIGFYGKPETYSQTDDEEDEYWTRCAFAWIGWRASGEMRV